jgi:hypothetical protein
MRSFAVKLTLIGLFLGVAVMHWPERVEAYSTSVHLLPAIKGTSVKDYGLHFDEVDSTFGAYDYSATATTTVYLRGKLFSDGVGLSSLQILERIIL